MTFTCLQLSAAQMAHIAPKAREASDAIGHFYRLKARGQVLLEPKLTMEVGRAHLFQSLCCASSEPSLALCKWIGVSGRNRDRGLANVSGIVILSDFETGQPLAMLDAATLTAVRTAATSLCAAEHLARKDARIFGLIGTGVQAHAHLDLFHQIFQDLAEVRILGGHKGCDDVCRHAADLGLTTVVCDHPQDVVEHSDIIISSVPATADTAFLDATRLPRGSFVSAVDLGRSWLPDTIPAFDLIATDDHANSAEQQAQGIMPPTGRAVADLSELAEGRHPGRTGPDQKTAFIFPGFALSDLALATYYLEAARRVEIGVTIAF